jgi:hypothetical protein
MTNISQAILKKRHIYGITYKKNERMAGKGNAAKRGFQNELICNSQKILS